MSSEKRITASRASGALSRGPKSPQGKARSSRNATRHGLLARVVVLEEEPDDAFRKLCQAYDLRFEPRDEVEAGMVHEMVATYWRMRRAWAIENRYVDTAMAVQDGPSATDRLMTAFSSLADSNRLNLLHRYETRLHMMFQRAFRNLLALRKTTADLPGVAAESAPARHPSAADLPAQLRAVPNEPRIPFPSNKPDLAEPRSNLFPHPHPQSADPVLDTTPKGS